MMETAAVTPMSVPSSVVSVRPCCSTPSVRIPSPLRSQQEADATQPGVTCNESNKGNLQRYGQKVRESQSRGLYPGRPVGAGWEGGYGHLEKAD